MLYFGYASNMLTKRMHISCPFAKKIGVAKLKDFHLIFSGYSESWKGAKATVVESSGDFIWGVVWEISEELENELDKQEVGYESIKVSVVTPDGSELLCKCYKKLLLPNDYSKPSLVYKTVIISGAKEHMLPESYICHIKTYEDNGYNGPVDVLF